MPSSWSLPEPMLAAPTADPALPPGHAAEPKWDGWRALLSWNAGKAVLRSRRGTDLTPSFPEVRSGAAQLPDATALDGELVVWDDAGRLAFERLQDRLQRRGAGATRLAEQWPAHFVAFDLLRLAGTDTNSWPYRRRREALETLFAEHHLTAPWTLCPSTTDPDTVREWLTSWTDVGLEGVVYKKLASTYQPGARRWRKYKVRETQDALVGAFTGSPAAPRTLLLGRYDRDGRLRYVGRSTVLPAAAGRSLAPLLVPARADHPWEGWSFSAGWGTRESLDVTLVVPELVVEVAVDVALDSAGRWRHPARWHRARTDLAPSEAPLFRRVE